MGGGGLCVWEPGSMIEREGGRVGGWVGGRKKVGRYKGIGRVGGWEGGRWRGREGASERATEIGREGWTPIEWRRTEPVTVQQKRLYVDGSGRETSKYLLPDQTHHHFQSTVLYLLPHTRAARTCRLWDQTIT